MKKLAFLLFLGLIHSMNLQAQQDPEYTQYMYNMSIVNPAYATGDVGIVKAGLLYRSQWVGAVGAPKSATAFVHAPLNDKIEIGLSFINDEIGDGALNENNIGANFAYKLQLSKKTYLSFGAKAGVTLFNTQFNDFILNSGNSSSDPAFAENINDSFLNIGAGLYLYGDRFYVGLSAPNFLGNKHLTQQNGISALGSENIHGFLTGGYIFEISEKLDFKPSFMVKSVQGAPLSMDVNANVRYLENLEAGLSYRFDDSFSVLVNYGITKSLRIGYAYDYTTSNLGNFNSGTHEVILLLDMNFSGSKNYSSPRFF
ncbi:MAG: type IX secretion system membrane protein PorP/SprF [Maribacter sp.]